VRALWGRTSGRPLALAIAVACLGAIPSVRAGEGATVAGVRLERYVTVKATIRSDGALDVEPAAGFERRSDSSGRVLSDTPLTPEGRAPLAPIGQFGCTAFGESPDRTDHTAAGPVRVDVDRPGGASRSAFHLSSLRDARGVNGRPTTQVLVCAVGGARPVGGWRLLQAGVGASYDSRTTYKLGMDWPKGEAAADTEKGFAFGADSDVGAVGRIHQQPGGKLEGSLVGPFDSDFNDTFNNAVAGWWQTPCLDDAEVCGAADGSDAFQGSIAGGLWEFFTDEIPAEGLRFRLASFTALACFTADGCNTAAN
jgi:hypothetical protein